MQTSNKSVTNVLTKLNERLNQMDGGRLLVNSHHLSSWLCSVYVAEFSRNNKDIKYNDSFDKCYPIIEDICKTKGDFIQKEELMKLVEQKITPTLQ